MLRAMPGFLGLLIVLFSCYTTIAVPAVPAGPTCSRDATTSAVSSAFTFLQTVSDLTRNINADVTDTQIASLCQNGQLLKTYQTFISKCIALNVPGIHEVIAGSVKLLDICKASNQPNLVANLKAKQACEKKLSSTVPTYAGCLGQMSKSFDALAQNTKKPNFPSTGFQLSSVCCALKSYDDCLGQSYQKVCTAQSVQVIRKFLDGIYGAFNCFEEFSLC